MPKRTQSFRAWQMQRLADPKRAASYLSEAYKDSKESFLTALGKVAQANQMSKVAKEAGVQRETLYRSLSNQGNPTFDTLSSILSAVGVRIDFSPVGADPIPTAFAVTGVSALQADVEKKSEGNFSAGYGDFNSLLESESTTHLSGNRTWSDQGAALYAIGGNC